jgi:hypothetical protein
VADFRVWNNQNLPSSGIARYANERLNADKLLAYCVTVINRPAKKRGRKDISSIDINQAAAENEVIRKSVSCSSLKNTVNALMGLWKSQHAVNNFII